MSRTPEGKIKDQVKKLLDEYPHYRFMPVPSGYGETTLDFLVCYKGRFLAIETKAPGNVATPRQVMIIGEIIANGGHAVIVDGPAGLATLRFILELGI
jgi:hypothetical protein